jgi:hypothetical protein
MINFGLNYGYDGTLVNGTGKKGLRVIERVVGMLKEIGGVMVRSYRLVRTEVVMMKWVKEKSLKCLGCSP